MNSVDPCRIEGYKLIGLEAYFQLNHKVPGFVFVPVSSGGHLIGLLKAYLDSKQAGFIDSLPNFVGVQAQGCAPIAMAYQKGKERFERIAKANTVAQAISNPDPPGGNIALKLIRENNGVIIDVGSRNPGRPEDIGGM